MEWAVLGGFLRFAIESFVFDINAVCFVGEMFSDEWNSHFIIESICQWRTFCFVLFLVERSEK